MRALRLVLVAALLGGASATDVRVQVSDPTLLAAVQDALKALSTGGQSYSLVNGQGPVFTLGGGAAFSPDVASRSFGGASPRVEFNPKGPIPLGQAVQSELRRLLGLTAASAGTSTAGTSAAGTSTTSDSTAGTSTAATSGTSTAGASTAGSSTAGTSGTSTAGTSTAATSTPPVKAGPADLNGDGVVDPGDLAIVMGSLGQSAPNLPADLNKDGKVDQQDLEAFAKLYKLP